MCRVSLEERLRHHQDGRDARLGEQDLAAVLDHLDVVGRRLGGPGDLAGLELQHRGRVGVGRLDGDVSPAGRRGRQAVLLQPVTHGHVLGVAQRWRVDDLSLEAGSAGNPGLDDDRRASGRRPGNDLDGGAAGLLERVDRGVRADVGGVELPGEDGRGLLGPAVVHRRGQLAGAAEVLAEEALLNADERGRMRDVGQQSEPHGHGRAAGAGATGTARTRGARRAGRSAARQNKRPHHDRANTGAKNWSPH